MSRPKEVFYFDDPDSPYDSSTLRLYHGTPRYSGWYYTSKYNGLNCGLFGPYKTELKARKALNKEKEQDETTRTKKTGRKTRNPAN